MLRSPLLELHWLWHLAPQQLSVVPHQPYSLQHRPPGHTDPPACFPHCSSDQGASSPKRDKPKNIIADVISIFHEMLRVRGQWYLGILLLSS
ncbi:hypothetical protein Nepgr_004759 [Nepenthes gracilis]|uniref:Uncharacterized protein n=1 Tax=Nepenthes gracilis TaxID=150966 RepID=A0AAD3S1Z5_NEPGR|nr:hypothetical protein Nepgr_004759 [Nepenthes gracilis]